MIAKNIISTVHRKMYLNRLGYHINTILLTSGIREQLKYILYLRGQEKKTDIVAMNKSCKFFHDNQDRIENIEKLLADDKSRIVYNEMINYRCKGTALEKGLYSLSDQYFVEGIIEIENDEIFIDCGGYVGETTQTLITLAKKKNKRIKKSIIFEPEKELYKIAVRHFKGSENIEIHNKGVSSENGFLYIVTERLGESRLVDDATLGNECLEVVSIDRFDGCRDATFIKMDIEGAELDALEGAKETIIKNRPKMAICIYHSDEDMIRIIEYIHRIVPEYRLFIRQHSRVKNETVLYCVI